MIEITLTGNTLEECALTLERELDSIIQMLPQEEIAVFLHAKHHLNDYVSALSNVFYNYENLGFQYNYPTGKVPIGAVYYFGMK